jgi:hypothetical protein
MPPPPPAPDIGRASAKRSQHIRDTDPVGAPATSLTAFRSGGGIYRCLAVASDRAEDLDETLEAVANQATLT